MKTENFTQKYKQCEATKSRDVESCDAFIGKEWRASHDAAMVHGEPPAGVLVDRSWKRERISTFEDLSEGKNPHLLRAVPMS